MYYAYIKEQQELEEPRKNQQLLLYMRLRGISEEATFVDDNGKTEWLELLGTLSEGDCLLIRSVEDIADDYSELLDTFQIMQKKAIELYSCKEPFFCGDTYYDSLKQIINLSEIFKKKRRVMGYQKAVSEGTVGRPKKSKEISLALTLYASGEYTLQQIEEIAGISKSTLYRAKDKITEGKTG